MGGDFNRHHPMWNPINYQRHEESASEIIDLAAGLNLELLIPPGTVTYPTAKTAIDLVWGNRAARQNMLKCKIDRQNDHGSDHLPIKTIIAMDLEVPEAQPRLNFSKANWKEFEEQVRVNVAPIPAHRSCKTEAEIDKRVEQLTEAIQKAIEVTVPLKKECPHSKRWWNEEIGKLRKEANKLRNTYSRTRHETDRKAWRRKANEYTKEIREAKKKKWREYTSEADGKSIWQIKEYITKPPTQNVIPTLNGTSKTHQQKTEALRQTFFPPPPPANLTDIRSSGKSSESESESEEQPEEIPYTSAITIQQIRRAVNKTAPNKAPGPDGIPNAVIKKALPHIEWHLRTIMQASINLGYFPKAFKETKTVVIRKSGKPDYTVPKAYRPIALENTMGKIMESIIAESISYLTEEYHLLPENHFGGRPGRSTEDAMMILVENIHKAWRNNNVFTAVYLDVAGAFNNVHHQRLLHNLRKRQIPERIIQWIESFLKERSTKLHFNGMASDSIPILVGVPQGSPLSPILYMFYNADLLDITEDQDSAISLGFIDDVVYGVEGGTDRGNARRITRILKKAEEWRKKHGAQFETSKYVLVHYTRNHNKTTSASVKIDNTRIEASEHARYLGVIFDKQLRFKQHMAQVVKKGTSAAIALAGIAKCNWGAPFQQVRQLFQAVIAPKIDYGAIVWHRPKDKGTMGTRQVKELTTIQRIAMKAILGCYRTTPTTAMEIEAGLAPTWIRLQTKTLIAVTRMQSLSKDHPIQKWLGKARTSRTAGIRHISPLENILRQFADEVTRTEHIEPYIRPPWWTLKAKIHISPDKKTAEAYHDKIAKETQRGRMHIYTDGSGIDEKIGAAAYNKTLNHTSHQHLGHQMKYNVYAAELTAIQLGISQWKRVRGLYPVCNIYIDSQAACSSIAKPGRQSGQGIIMNILDQIDEIGPQQQLNIVWIPGHQGIEGNERADKEAKIAAQSPETSGQIKHPPQKACRAQDIKTKAKVQWQETWKTNNTTA